MTSWSATLLGCARKASEMTNWISIDHVHVRASERVSASVLVETDCHCARPVRMWLFPIGSRECEQFMTRKDAQMISDTYLNHEEHTTNHTIDFYYSCTRILSSSSGNKQKDWIGLLESPVEGQPKRLPFNSGISIFLYGNKWRYLVPARMAFGFEEKDTVKGNAQPPTTKT